MNWKIKDLRNSRILIMGLGLNGGGLASARFLASHGARVTVTDLRNAGDLAPSIAALSDYSIDFVLGEHRMKDFSDADLVIKNPAVKIDSPYLQAAKNVETDISLFLRLCPTLHIIAVTGSKGKSSTVSALHQCLKLKDANARLGGNITVSPLSFLDELDRNTPVVLELSSWQLADLKEKNLLHPRISLITNLMHDHQNAYDSMEQYAADKALLFRDQNPDSYLILNGDDPWNSYFSERTPTRTAFFSSGRPAEDLGPAAWLDDRGRGLLRIEGKEELVFHKLAVPGPHFRSNMLSAGLLLRLLGMETSTIRRGLESFTGIPHRMEPFYTSGDIVFYNDSAATIPEACKAALESFEEPIVLITGGTDKDLDFSGMTDSYRKARAIYLLSGSGTEKIIPVLKQGNIPFYGPYKNLETLLDDLLAALLPKDRVILSPGCASFGLFLNEFDRGNRFKQGIIDRFSRS